MRESVWVDIMGLVVLRRICGTVESVGEETMGRVFESARLLFVGVSRVFMEGKEREITRSTA
jgi:hypothetical protein